MLTFFIVIHVGVCLFLCLIILMQSGRGGGLTETFSGAESMFGAKTNTVLVKATTVLATVFIVTCLTLAYFSSKSNKSLISEEALQSEAKTEKAATTGAVLPAVPATPTEQPPTTGENANLPESQNQPAEPAAAPNPQ